MDLVEAIRRGHADEVSTQLDADNTLLEKEVRTAGGKVSGFRPLALAAHSGQLGVAKMLVDRGAKVDAPVGWGGTALSYAAEMGHEDVVKFLLDQDAQALIRDRMGWTPLMLAARKGRLGVVQVLAERTGEEGLEMRDRTGRTALYCTAEGGHAATVILLLSKGAHANTEDEDGKTPLMVTAERCHLGVAEILQAAVPAYLNRRDRYGKTALSYATERGHTQIMRFLMEEGADAGPDSRMYAMTPFMAAAQKGQVDEMAVQMRVQDMRGQGLDERYDSGMTVLHHAAKRGFVEIVGLLLDNGAQANQKDRSGMTPLMVAASEGHSLEVMKMLVQDMGGQGLDEGDDGGKTALHHAVACSRVSIIHRAGRNTLDQRPICEQMVQFLLLAGADPSITDRSGRTPQVLAKLMWRQGCVEAFNVSMRKNMSAMKAAS